MVRAMTIGLRIQARRKAMGLTQAALAARVIHPEAPRVNVHQGDVSHWEGDDSPPPTRLLVPLASALSVSVDWLLTGEGAAVGDAA